MDWFRLKHTIRLCTMRSAIGRAKYIREHNIFHHMGEKCMVMFRKIPLYPQLISIGDNCWIASNVTFATHDVIHRMLNNYVKDYEFQEYIGCIDIKDNVFIGANTIILSNVEIGSNTVIAAGSYVNKDIPGNGVYGGGYLLSLFAPWMILLKNEKIRKKFSLKRKRKRYLRGRYKRTGKDL